MKVYLESVGCKLNQSERDALARQFALAGHTVVLWPENADVCVVNTCAVTHAATRKSRHRFRHLHRLSPGARLVAMGCYAELSEDGLVIDLSVSNVRKGDLVSLVESQAEGWGLAEIHPEAVPNHDLALLPRTRPLVKIQDGCDNACAYCIVHVLRGKQHSRPRDEVLKQVADMVRQGYHEVVLTGVHVGSYGRESGDSLVALVRAILAHPLAPERLRLSSIEPWDLTPGFFSLWQDPRLCPHLHLPLQSGCDETLRRMNRSYTAVEYADLAAEARCAIPDLALTTDLIAGFPGETDDEWAASAAFVERMAFSRVHVFAYSPRPGTPAAAMPDQVALSVRRRRARQLREVARRCGEAYRRQFIGRTLTVLWETRAGDGQWSGLTGNYIRVHAASAEDLHNTLRPARLCALRGGGMQGEI